MKRDIDFASCMGTVARVLLGELTSKRGHEWRYGANGSLCIDIKAGTWFDFEANEGGGVLAFIKRQKGLEGSDALQFLRDIGCAVDITGSTPAHEIPYDIAADPFHGCVILKNSSKQFHIVQTWQYTDETDAELFEVCRLENGDRGANGKPVKTYRQRHKGADGVCIDNVNGIRQVPYRLPKLIDAIAQSNTVFVVEGEKCVDAVIALGAAATCNAMGAGKWPDELVPFFKGADVVILPDNDEPGTKHAGNYHLDLPK